MQPLHLLDIFVPFLMLFAGQTIFVMTIYSSVTAEITNAVCHFEIERWHNIIKSQEKTIYITSSKIGSCTMKVQFTLGYKFIKVCA